MDKDFLLGYFKNPSLLGELSIDYLQQLIRKYPYFQAAHILLVKKLQIENSDAFIQQLEESSVFISSRELLHRFLHLENDENEIVLYESVKSQEIASEEKKNEIAIQEVDIKEPQVEILENEIKPDPLENFDSFIEYGDLISYSPEPVPVKISIEPLEECDEIQDNKEEIEEDENFSENIRDVIPINIENPNIEVNPENVESEIAADRINWEDFSMQYEANAEIDIDPLNIGEDSVSIIPIIPMLINLPTNREKEVVRQNKSNNIRIDEPDSLQQSIERALLSQIEDANSDWDESVEMKYQPVMEVIKPKNIEFYPCLFPRLNQFAKDIEEVELEKVENVDDNNTYSQTEDEEPIDLNDEGPQLLPEYFDESELVTTIDEATPCEIPTKEKIETESRSQFDLISKFIKENPRLPKIDDQGNEIIDISKGSVRPDIFPVTETLAELYIKQGYYSKAIFTFEKLSLKYPEKSIYFADQIKKLENYIK